MIKNAIKTFILHKINKYCVRTCIQTGPNVGQIASEKLKNDEIAGKLLCVQSN